MAFLLQNMTITRTTFGALPNTGPIMHFYLSPTDNAATITGSGYFNNIASSLRTGDALYFYPSDTANTGVATVTAVTPNVTVSVFL